MKKVSTFLWTPVNETIAYLYRPGAKKNSPLSQVSAHLVRDNRGINQSWAKSSNLLTKSPSCTTVSTVHNICAFKPINVKHLWKKNVQNFWEPHYIVFQLEKSKLFSILISKCNEINSNFKTFHNHTTLNGRLPLSSLCKVIHLNCKDHMKIQIFYLPHTKNNREKHLILIQDKYSTFGSLKLTPF